MSYCMAQDGYRCSNRNKCRASSKMCRNINVHEPPERETSRNKRQPHDGIPSGQLPPPDPPSGDWELQYCQWQGWTWVKKEDKGVQNPKPAKYIQPPEQHGGEDPKSSQNKQPPKKKNGLFSSCFKKKETTPPEPAKSSETFLQGRPPPKQANTDQKVDKPARPQSSDDSDDYCFCCPCTQVYCPCMLQNCCCCSGDHSFEEDKMKDSKSTETQTCRCEVKEQATKMSDVNLPKRKRCRCRRPVCCPCMRSTCCPCVQNTCCPCKKTEKKESGTSKEINSEIINYRLTNNSKPTAVDFLNLKTDFSTLHKSLDLLIKNNINIMGLFNDKKEINNMKPNLSSNHTISFLSNDNLTKRTDQEHSKLLTAVCDAILSSHKFDNDKVKSIKPVSSKTSQKHCETKDSQNSFNIFSSRGFLEKILSDLNFPTLTKSDDDLNKEIGVQVDRKKKLMRNKSRILTAPRFPRKVEALKKTIDLMRLGYYDKVTRRCVKKPESENIKLSIDCTPQASTSKNDDPSASQTIDNLLNSIDFLGASASKTGMEDETVQAVHLLDTTPPPFSDLDLLLSLDDDNQIVKREES